MTQSTITIGYQRKNGSVAVLATLNNIGNKLDEATFDDTILTLVSSFAESLGKDVQAWERQDAPTYLDSIEDAKDVTPNY